MIADPVFLAGSSPPGALPPSFRPIVAEPTLAAESIPACAGSSDSARIADLVRAIGAASDVQRAAGARRDAILDARQDYPEPPEPLFQRPSDGMFSSLFGGRYPGHGMRPSPLQGRWWFGSDEAIAVLRSDGAVFAGTLTRVEDSAKARVAEILAAYDGWVAEMGTWRVSTGLEAAEADWHAALEVCWGLWSQLAEVRARTLPDFVLKASLMVHDVADLETSEAEARKQFSGFDLVQTLMGYDLARLFFEGGLIDTAHLPPASLDAPLVKAWAEHSRLVAKLGPVIDDAHDAIGREIDVVGDLIRDLPALSLEGIGIKASWALLHTAKGEQDLAGVLQQVEAFAHRHRKPAKLVDVPRLEQEAMGGLPAADWSLYHLFVRWLESATEYRAREAEEIKVGEQHGFASDAYYAAHASTEAEEVANRALRLGLLETPAASTQGLQLKAMVYSWLCQGMSEVSSKAEYEARHQTASSDAFAYGIARDLVRLGAPAVLGQHVTAPHVGVEERAA